MAEWRFTGTVLHVVDGDTFDVVIDLGFRTYSHQRVRLAGVDAPELRTPEGQAALAFVRGLLPEGATVTLHTEKPAEKYGRYLARVTLSDGRDLTSALIEGGHGRAYAGGRR